MSYSLQSRLSRILAIAVLVCGVFASFVAFYFAYVEAQEFQDDALRQIAAIASSVSGKSEATGNATEDSDSRVQVIHLPNDSRPAWLSANIAPGFHTLSESSGEEKERVFVRRVAGSDRIVVAQSTEIRNEIALNSALRTLLPLLILLPILVILTATIVRRAFKPLRTLSANLDCQAAEKTVQISDKGLPGEIIPFVQAINRLLGRVEKLVSDQRRFIADAAHELRTPLAALSLQAQNLAKAESPQQMRERLAPLQAGLERTRRLTVQLLDLARLQLGKPSLEEVDVQTLARELIAEFIPLAETKRIDLGMEDNGLRRLYSDPHILSLILRNGLDNAIKYTPAGGSVTIHLKGDAAGARIEIVDSGPGIPPSEIGRAFDAFHRLSVVGEGSGLGLAIAQEAAAQLGGSVSLSNRKGMHGVVYCYEQPLSFR